MNLDPRTSETEIYKRMGKFGWKFEDLYTLRSALFVFKNKSEFQIGKHEQNIHTRSHNSMLSVSPQWNKAHSRTQLRYKGTKIFNSLPPNIRNENRISTYKNNIKSLLMSVPRLYSIYFLLVSFGRWDWKYVNLIKLLLLYLDSCSHYLLC